MGEWVSKGKSGALSERVRQAMSEGWVGGWVRAKVRRGTSGIAGAYKSVITQCKGKKGSFPSDMYVARHEMEGKTA